MIQIAAREAVVIANLDAHRKPREILDKVLQKRGRMPRPMPVATCSWAYKWLGWDRYALVNEANDLRQQRRADPITARIADLHSQIDIAKGLDAAAKENLKQDIRNVLQHDYGKHQESYTIECFQTATAQTNFFPGSHEHMKSEKRSLSRNKQRAITAELTVKRAFSFGLQVQGLPDMKDRSSIFEVKNRLYREDDMPGEKFRRADHAQLMVYLVLAEEDASFQQPLMGYLVEHMRVGEEDVLSVELRDAPYTKVEPFIKPVGPQEAGHLVVTQYTLEQAKAYWSTVIVPELIKFCQLAETLLHDPEVLHSYLSAIDKDMWYTEHAV